jgi:phospholipid transport system transporter-binding protein
MTVAASLSFSEDTMRLSGVIDFTSAVAIQERGDTWLRERAPAQCRLEMSGVTRSNSAGTALLLAWLRSASEAGKHLTVEHPPETLVALMQLAGLDRVLMDHSASTTH